MQDHRRKSVGLSLHRHLKYWQNAWRIDGRTGRRTVQSACEVSLGQLTGNSNRKIKKEWKCQLLRWWWFSWFCLLTSICFMKLPPQIDRSVSVSVAVVFGLTTPTLSSGIGEGSLFRPGRTPTNDTEASTKASTNFFSAQYQNGWKKTTQKTTSG